MQRAYNFGAGPAMLPIEVLAKIQKDIFNWENTGVSVMEIGHRTPQIQDLILQIQAKLRRLLKIPENYKIILTTGGAQGQFDAIPLNLTKYNQEVDYLVTGIWSEKAANFARHHARVNLSLNLNSSNNTIPGVENWNLNPNAAYLYYCPNETVNGLAFNYIPKVNNVPLIGDFTSSILSEPLDINKFGIVFASAQKNLGIAGITLLIIRDDLLEQARDYTPVVWNFKLQAENHSSLNTIPTFPIYVMNLMLDWIDSKGGVEEMSQINQKKANQLYQYIDSSELFFNSVDSQNRSLINIVFNLRREELLSQFLTEANNKGLKYLAGHKLVGGLRASLYNAMPIDGVNQLIEFMQDFASKNA